MPTPLLFDPFRLKGITARNRIVVSPMCQYASVDGGPTDWHLAHLGRYGIGGAGIIFYEETAIEAEGRKTLHCAGIYTDGHVAQYRRITDFVRSLGAVPAMQLGHGGSKSSTKGPHETTLMAPEAGGWQSVSASTLPATPGLPPPREMSLAEIDGMIAKWGVAARRCDEAGFDILEVHGAHGYLIHQFLSPVTNRRIDAYGGSLENRMRLALQITREVRRNWPEHKPLLFRVSAVDGKGGIWGMQDTLALCRALVDCGIDGIDVSSGGISGGGPMGPVPRLPGYHVPYARQIKAETGLMTMAPGFITEPAQAEELLRSGAIDLVCMARELMADSEWPVRAARELGYPGALDLYPPQFSFRLTEREKSRAMEINQPGAVFPV